MATGMSSRKTASLTMKRYSLVLLMQLYVHFLFEQDLSARRGYYTSEGFVSEQVTELYRPSKIVIALKVGHRDINGSLLLPASMLKYRLPI